MNALVTAGHFDVEVQGRKYPFAPPSALLPEVLEPLPRTLFGPLEIPPGNKESLMRSFQASAKKLDQTCDQTATYLTKFAGETKVQITRPTFPPAMRAEAAALPVDELHVHLNSALLSRCRQTSLTMVNTLDLLVDAEQVGLLQWFSDDVCRYTYYQNTLEDRDLGIKQRLDGSTEHVRERWHRHRRITHDLMNATAHPFPGNDVRKPPQVDTLLYSAPEFLRPFFSIVSGTQIFEETIERAHLSERINTETPPVFKEEVQWDPALCLGHYVLAGWDERALPVPVKTRWF